MKKIVILGSSIAAIEAIEILKQKGEYDIILFAFDGFLPYKREMIPSFISKEINASEVLYKNKEYFQENNIKVFYDKKLHRISLSRSRVTTQDKEQYGFDYLFVANMPLVKYPDIKGTNKHGVYNTSKFSSVNQLFDNMPFIEIVTIQSEGLYGLELAFALAKQRKEVVLVFPKSNHIKELFSSEGFETLKEVLHENNIKIIEGQSIVELLGESDIKAIRLSQDKVYATQAVIFDNVKDNYKIFDGTSLKVDGSIETNDSFQTDVANVYAFDHCATTSVEYWDSTVPKNTQLLIEEGKKVALNICEENYDIKDVPIVHSFKVNEVYIDVIGYTAVDAQVQKYTQRSVEEKSVQQFFVLNNKLIGACQINAHHMKDKIVADIARSAQWDTLDYIKEDLSQQNIENSQESASLGGDSSNDEGLTQINQSEVGN